MFVHAVPDGVHGSVGVSKHIMPNSAYQCGVRQHVAKRGEIVPLLIVRSSRLVFWVKIFA